MNTKTEVNILVETHLDVVKWVIRKHIYTNKNIYGFEFDDLFQEGCLCLWKAAETYIPERAEFKTYAQKVVKNGLISYCRKLSERNTKISILSLDAPLNSDKPNRTTFAEILTTADVYTDIDTLAFLSQLKQEYTGTIRLGIEALEWLVRGYTITEIAEIYGIKPNLVGARISRATQYLRQNSYFSEYINKADVEKRAA